MHKPILAAIVLAAISTPVLAQVGPGPANPIVMGPGARGVETPQTGSTGDEGALSYTPTGRAQDVISNDSAAGGNAGQPSRAAPQGGGGGGSGGSNN